MSEARRVLEDIIAAYSKSPHTFPTTECTVFFRRKNNNFKPYQEEHYQPDNDKFCNIKLLGSIDFAGQEQLLVCTMQVQARRALHERVGKKQQYEQAKRILKEDGQYNGGIFIFYDNTGHFRFSLIYGTLARNTSGKIVNSYSNFRRFTYFVGKDRYNKTFLERIGDGDFSSFAAIQQSFSVEPVTQEFYRRLEAWYHWAVKHAVFPKDAEVTNGRPSVPVIRLITRIVFMWFMRERKLIPPELFDPQFAAEQLKDSGDDSPPLLPCHFTKSLFCYIEYRTRSTHIS